MAELKRTLGFWMTSAFVFLNLVNTGIFFTVALAASTAGKGVILALVILAMMSIYTAMCFSELTTMFPSAGGVYEFAKQAFGSFVSFEVGWIIWLINNIATSLLVIAAVEYLFPAGSLDALPIPAQAVKLGLAILAILLMNYIAYRGAEDSARLMLTLAVFTLLLFLVILIPGGISFQMETLHIMHVDWFVIAIAAFLLSETFFGWESISFMAEEIIEPEKTIPKALILTTTFTAFASVAVGVITLDVLGIGTLVSGEFARPVIAVLQEMGFSQWIILGANLGIVISFLGNAAGGVIGNPRLLMALSRDKLFIEQFADIHPRYQTPYRGVLIQTIVAILVVLLAAGNYQRLLELVVVPSIILYALMMFLVPYFRFKKKQTQRPYRAPFGAFLPFVLVIGYLGMLLLWAFYNPDAGIWMWYNAQAITQLRLLGSFMLFSVPIYLLLTYFYNPDVLINTVNKFALVNLVFEDILVPRRVRRRVLEILDESRGKHIVEIGCGVGSLTMHLADHVGSDGVVYAIDFSNHNTRIAEKRILKKGHTHVKVIHDPHLVNRIHPDVQNADIVVSIGNLSYLQDVPRILKEMYSLLSPRGKICFVEYVDFFWFLPNSPKWLSHHDEIRRLFSEAGFAINVEVKRGLFWKYLYIYGFKERSGVPYI